MAHKKGLGSSRNGRDSNAEAPRREGVRRPGGDRRRDHRAPARHPLQARRRRGHRPDDTIFATRPGMVQFAAGRRGRVISVAPARRGVAPADLLDRRPRRPSSGQLGVAVQSHFFSVGLDRELGRARGGRGGHAVDGRAVLRAARPGPAARRGGAPRRAAPAARRRRAGGRAPGRDGRPRGRVAVHTGAALHRRTPATRSATR